MHLTVNEYFWDESYDEIFINIFLKGVKKIHTDVVLTSQYIKVNFKPYIFECLLTDKIDVEKSKATFSNGLLVFSLKKQFSGLWHQLESEIMKDKALMKERREIALREYEEQVNLQEKQRNESKKENERYTLNEMMRIEKEEKQRIEDIKQSERDQAMADLQAWKENQIQKSQKEMLKIREARMAASEYHKHLVHDVSYDKTDGNSELLPVTGKSEKGKHNEIFDSLSVPIPESAPVRESCKIGVKFTQRVFPTPERESTKSLEEEWLKKQAQRRKIPDINNDDLTDEQKDPLWLRNKGNSLFQAGDFQGAVAAYSHAIELGGKMHSLYSNRAACHIKLRNFFKALEDASKALELLDPPVQQNLQARLRAHVRRGTAFVSLQMYREGLLDYEAALKLDPDNVSLKDDITKLNVFMDNYKEDLDRLD